MKALKASVGLLAMLGLVACGSDSKSGQQVAPRLEAPVISGSASLTFPGLTGSPSCSLEWLPASGETKAALSAATCDSKLFYGWDAGRPMTMRSEFTAPAGAAASASGHVECDGLDPEAVAGTIVSGVASFTWNAPNVGVDTACTATIQVTLTAAGKSPSAATVPMAFTLHPAKLVGFEKSTGDWQATATDGIAAVASGKGTLELDASAGDKYAEVLSQTDGYQAGYGDAGYSYFGGKGLVYEGDFFQAIDVYIDAKWAPAAAAGVPSFWIDMAPYHADPANYGAEHNFQLTATGSQVNVTADGATPIASLTKSGWYTFLMTFRKDADPTQPVISDLVVLNADGDVMGTATVKAVSPGGPFLSQDLLGNGYVWITVWQNGFAKDVLGIDNIRTALLPY